MLVLNCPKNLSGSDILPFLLDKIKSITLVPLDMASFSTWNKLIAP